MLYIVIQPYMIRELGLTGNDLVIYAIVANPYCNGEGSRNPTFKHWTIKDIMDWYPSLTYSMVRSSLDRLREKGLVEAIKDSSNPMIQTKAWRIIEK